jgi:hypothetical protein
MRGTGTLAGVVGSVFERGLRPLPGFSLAGFPSTELKAL